MCLLCFVFVPRKFEPRLIIRATTNISISIFLTNTQKKIHLLTNIYIYIRTFISHTQSLACTHHQISSSSTVVIAIHQNPYRSPPFSANPSAVTFIHHFDLLPLHRFNYSFILIFTFLLSVSIHIYYADSVTIDMNKQ